jgi:hypothetical protein
VHRRRADPTSPTRDLRNRGDSAREFACLRRRPRAAHRHTCALRDSLFGARHRAHGCAFLIPRQAPNLGLGSGPPFPVTRLVRVPLDPVRIYSSFGLAKEKLENPGNLRRGHGTSTCSGWRWMGGGGGGGGGVAQKSPKIKSRIQATGESRRPDSTVPAVSSGPWWIGEAAVASCLEMRSVRPSRRGVRETTAGELGARGLGASTSAAIIAVIISATAAAASPTASPTSRGKAKEIQAFRSLSGGVGATRDPRLPRRTLFGSRLARMERDSPPRRSVNSSASPIRCSLSRSNK